MCLNIFIGSDKELPIIKWLDESPAFYVYEVTEKDSEFKVIQEVIGTSRIYSFGSFMGCSCGLSYGDWSKEDKAEDHESRVLDVERMKDYLTFNRDNNLLIFATWWDFDNTNVKKVDFVLNQIDQGEFEFKEETILLVK